MKFDNNEHARTETRYTYWVDPAEADDDNVVSKLQRRKIKRMLGFRCGELVYLAHLDWNGRFCPTQVARLKRAKRKPRRSWGGPGDPDRVGDYFEVKVWSPAIFLAIVRIPGESWWAYIQLGSERVLTRGDGLIKADEVEKAITKVKKMTGTRRNSRWH